MCFLKSKFLSNTSRTSLWPDSFYILFIIVLTGVIFKGHNQLLHSDGSAKHHESHSTAEHHRHPVDRGRGLGHSQFTLGGVWRPLERHLGLRYSQSRGNSGVEAASVQASTVQHPRLSFPHRALGRDTQLQTERLCEHTFSHGQPSGSKALQWHGGFKRRVLCLLRCEPAQGVV